MRVQSTYYESRGGYGADENEPPIGCVGSAAVSWSDTAEGRGATRASPLIPGPLWPLSAKHRSCRAGGRFQPGAIPNRRQHSDLPRHDSELFDTIISAASHGQSSLSMSHQCASGMSTPISAASCPPCTAVVPCRDPVCWSTSESLAAVLWAGRTIASQPQR